MNLLDNVLSATQFIHRAMAWHRRIHRQNLQPIRDFWTCPRTACKKARAFYAAIQARESHLRNCAVDTDDPLHPESCPMHPSPANEVTAK